MVDIAAISGVLSSLKAATDITRSVIGLRDAEMMREKVIELQLAIMSANQSALDAMASQHELSNRVRELEEQLRKRVSKPCPICGLVMKTTKVEPDRIFGDMGVQQHTLECSCGHKEERQIDPAKG